MAIAGSVGFSVELGDALACFSESASRVVVSVAAEGVDDVFERASRAQVPVTLLGEAGGGVLAADGAFRVELDAATRAWREAIPSIMSGARA
jgi:phosphoribosylformylglycinamidine synthase